MPFTTSTRPHVHLPMVEAARVLTRTAETRQNARQDPFLNLPSSVPYRQSWRSSALLLHERLELVL